MQLLGQEFWDRKELSSEAHQSERTIARWDAKREGPPRVKIGRKWYYPASEACKWLQAKIEYQCNAPQPDDEVDAATGDGYMQD